MDGVEDPEQKIMSQFFYILATQVTAVVANSYQCQWYEFASGEMYTYQLTLQKNTALVSVTNVW
jgi:hypothetical protein